MALEKIGLEAIMDMKNFDKGSARYDKEIAGMNKRTSSAAKGITGALGGIAKVAGGMLAAGAIRAIGGSMKEMITVGAEMQGVQAAFDGVGGSIERMREGSLGMVTDIDLMKSFNSAAQLVSKDFAKQLPDAMGYLSKVAAATGQDMNFMLDSLVKGVGRVSPMILDNLGVQVNLTEATEEYAAAIGKDVKALTKQEQQAAVMAKTMELLKRNTASMPPVLGTSAQSMAVLDTQMKNFRIAVGAAAAPVLNLLLKPLAELAIRVLPLVIEKVNALSARIVDFAGRTDEFKAIVTNFIAPIRTGIEGVPALFDSLLTLMPASWQNIWNTIIPQLTETITGLPTRLIEAFQTGGVGAVFSEVFASAFDVVGAIGTIKTGIVDGFFQLGQDLLTSLSTTFPSLAPIIDGALLPILTTAQTLWDTFKLMKAQVIEALIGMGTEAATALPPFKDILASVATILVNLSQAVLPLFTSAFDFVTTTLIPAAIGVIETLVPIIATLGERVFDVASRVFPILVDVVEAIVTHGIPAFMAILEAAIPIVDNIIGVLLNMAEDVMPVAIAVYETITDVITENMPLIESIITDTLTIIQAAWDLVWPALQATVETVLAVVKPLIDGSLTFIAGLFSAIVLLIQGDWEGMWETLKTAVTTAATKLWEAVTNLVNGVVNIFKTIFGISSDSTVMIGIAGDLVNGLISGLFGKQADLVIQVIQLATAGWQALIDMLPDFTSAGSDLIGGFISGITAKASEAATAALDAAKGAVSAVTGFLGISSPSKKFEEIGEAIPEGLGLGIEKASPQLEGPLGSVMGVFDGIIAWLTDLAGVLGGGSMAIAAEAMEDFADGVEDLSTAFVQIAEAVHLLKTGKIDTDDITRFLDEFVRFGQEANARMLLAYKAIGLKNLQRGHQAAKRLGETLGYISVDLSKLKVGDMPNLTAYFDQLDIVIRRAHNMVMAMGKEFGAVALETVAGWAKFIEGTFVLLRAPLSDIKPAEAAGFTEKVTLYFAQLSEVMTIIREWLGKTTTEMAAEYKMAGEVAGYATGILGLVSTGVDALTALAKYKPVDNLPALITGFAANLDIMISELATLASSMEEDATESASKILSAASGMLGIVSTGIDALTAIAKYKPVKDLVSLIVGFSSNVYTVVSELGMLATSLEEDATEAAAKILDSATSMLGIVSSGVDALAAIAKYKPVLDIGQRMMDFGAHMAIVIYELDVLADTFKGYGLKASGNLLSAANGMLGIVSSGVDALVAITKYKPVLDIGQRMMDFGADMMLVIYELDVLADTFVGQGISAASKMLTAMQGMVGIIKPGVDALASITTYEPVVDIGQRMMAFGADMMLVIYELDVLADTFVGQGIGAAAKMLAAMQTMVGIVKPGVDALVAITTYEPVLDIGQRMMNFGADMMIVVNEILLLSQGFEVEGMAAAAAFSTHATAVVNLIKPAVDALVKIAEYKGVKKLRSKMRIFRRNLDRVLKEMIILAKAWEDKGIDAAAEFAKSAKEIIDLIKPSLDVLVKLAEWQGVKDLPNKIRLFENDLGRVLDSIDRMAMEWQFAIPDAKLFLVATQDIIGLIQDSIDDLIKLGTYKQGEVASAMQTVSEELQAFPDAVRGWRMDYRAAKNDAATFARLVDSIIESTQAAIAGLTGAFDNDDSVMESINDWPDAMRTAFDTVLEHFQTFGTDWAAGWIFLNDLIAQAWRNIDSIGELVRPGSLLLTRWASAFRIMLMDVNTLYGTATSGLLGVHNQLQWMWDNVTMGSGKIGQVVTNAFNNMATEAWSINAALAAIIANIDTLQGQGTGLGGGFRQLNSALRNVGNQWLGRQDQGPRDPYPWTSPIPPPDNPRPDDPLWLRGSAYGRTVVGTSPRDVTLNFGDVTINDVADLTTFSGLIRREVRDAISGA